VAAVYTGLIEQYNVPYRVDPVSIADILRNVAQVDGHGHPRHARLHGNE
jgi:hypothetical protein